MNERIKLLAEQVDRIKDMYNVGPVQRAAIEDFVDLIVQECTREYSKLINGEAVVLPKDREHAEALVRVGMFYLENNE